MRQKQTRKRQDSNCSLVEAEGTDQIQITIDPEMYIEEHSDDTVVCIRVPNQNYYVYLQANKYDTDTHTLSLHKNGKQWFTLSNESKTWEWTEKQFVEVVSTRIEKKKEREEETYEEPIQL